MLDLILTNQLIKAGPPGAHLLLVGDVDQLPSVGAGEVLRDVLAADTTPRSGSPRSFRQAQQFGVVVHAHRINAGQPPVFGEHPDFFLFGAEEPEATAQRVVDLVAHRIPGKFGIPARYPGVGADAPRPGRCRRAEYLLQQAIAPIGTVTALSITDRQLTVRTDRPGGGRSSRPRARWQVAGWAADRTEHAA